MRNRLIVVLLVPITVVLAALGAAYAWSVSRSIHQEFLNQQLGDLSYFATGARQSLRTANPSIVEHEMARYSELFSARIAIVDRTGAIWAESGFPAAGFDQHAADHVSHALAGRRSETIAPLSPWSGGDVVIAEPVFDDGNIIGAVMISANTDVPRSEILRAWFVLVIMLAFVITVLSFLVVSLANWVLQPMRRVDRAMAAIERGDMHARISNDTGPPEMRRTIRVFNQMAEEIERVVSRQQEFVLNASHELRNPLGALVMRMEYLATGLGPEWEDEVEQAREEGRRMSRILDTLLFMARSSKQDTPFTPVDIVAVVSSRIAAWEPIASTKNVRLHVDAPTRLTCVTDRTALESALDAVLDNALKFSPHGSSIDVTVESGSACVMTVRDRGPGLSEEDIERSTERFWRSRRDQNVPGSGLGLAIATDLITSVNGEMSLHPAEGGGLAVSLSLPIARDHA